MSNSISVVELSAALRDGAAALRSITMLQPVEGEGGKLFPATYAGGKYATEKRRVPDRQEPVECVVLNSVQSESNHAELALLDAVRRGHISLPLIEVDFTEANAKLRKDMPKLTSLEVPHRLADAILRDSVLPDGTRFSRSDYAARWGRANLWNATAIYELCPTALTFGMWGSPDKPGGLGAKFERAYISEIIGVDALIVDRRSGFRVDPLSVSSKIAVVPNGDAGFRVLGENEKAKNAQRPSELNHGNIVFDSTNGGVRCRYAEQTTVVSFGALRKLRFPIDGRTDPARDNAARTVLAAIGIAAGVLATERGVSLRSRCHLIPTAPRTWELLDRPGEDPKSYTIDSTAAIQLLKDAVAQAEAAGLKWMEQPLVLKPSAELVDLVRRSQEIAATEDDQEG